MGFYAGAARFNDQTKGKGSSGASPGKNITPGPGTYEDKRAIEQQTKMRPNAKPGSFGC